MSRRLFQLAIVLCTIGLTYAARAEDRTVTFAVHAVANGAALPPGLVAAVDVAGKQFAAQFGPDAIATVQATVPEGAQEVFASVPVVLGQRTVVPGMNGRDQYYQAVRDVSKRYCLPRPVRVVLAPGQASYSVQLTLAPAITVTGRGVDASGRGKVEFDVESIGKPYAPRVSSTEKFELTGVRQGVSTWIGFGAYNGINDEIKIVKLTAAQTATDLDLGSVVIDPRTPDAAVSLTAQNRPPRRADQENHDRAITLLSENGQRAYIFGIDEAGHVAAVPTETSVKVVAGTYHLVPGGFGGTLTANVLQLIESGRGKELAANGKKITLVPGENPAVVVDVTALVKGLTIADSPP